MTIVRCPSGLTGEVRKLKGKEANLFSNRAIVNKGLLFESILKNCWLETLDPGPYKLTEGARQPIWDGVLGGDSFYVILQIRAATYGRLYEFEYQCGNMGCRLKSGHKVWLGTPEEKQEDDSAITAMDLEVRELSAESRDTFLAGNKFETTLLSGEAVKFHLQLGRDGKKVAKLGPQATAEGRETTVSLWSRIDEIEGVHRNDLLNYLDDMDLDVQSALLDDIEAADFGVETLIPLECIHCGDIQEVMFPLGQEFWMPRRRRRARSLLPPAS